MSFMIYDNLLSLFHQVTNDGTNYIRPLLILICGMLLFNLPTVLYKVRMFFNGCLYFVMCWDKSWKKPADPGSIFGPHLSQALPVERKTVYFVRHAESTWNETFNKGSHRSVFQFVIGFIPNLVKAVLYEVYLLLSGKMDSWFYDSPLSYYGLTQVEEMASYLKDKPIEENTPEAVHLRILRADIGTPKSKIICSNLRRAVSTIACGFKDRLMKRTLNDKIYVVPCLQEISSNPDTLSLTPPHTPIVASWIEKGYKGCSFQETFNSQTDMSLHTGNKPLDTNGLKRMNEFCDYIFSPACADTTHIIVGGHSIWFRSFFHTYLPYSVNHISKQKKIVNCGIVTCDILKAETRRGPKYMIDPKTIKPVYGGFDMK